MSINKSSVLFFCIALAAVVNGFGNRHSRPVHHHQQSYGKQQHQSLCSGHTDGTLIGDTSSNCKRFFDCRNGHPIPLYCPPHKVFDSYIGACTYSHKAECNYIPVKPFEVKATAAPRPIIPTTAVPPSPIPTITEPNP